MKKSILLLLAFIAFSKSYAQDFIAHKSDVGISVGSLSYSGIYSSDGKFLDHTSMGVSVMYSHKIILPQQLFLRGEIMLGELAANNTDDKLSSNPNKGEFRCYNLEGSVKLVYEILNNEKFKLSPYVMAGGGVYYLFDYEAKQGEPKSSKDYMGFVLPAGGGIKYRITPRLRAFAEGNMRFFAKNLDNFPNKDIENENRYYTLALGVSYTLQNIRSLW